LKWRRAWELKRVKLPEEDEDKRGPETESESDGEAVEVVEGRYRRKCAWGRWPFKGSIGRRRPRWHNGGIPVRKGHVMIAFKGVRL
jgi:hypothetical protein